MRPLFALPLAIAVLLLLAALGGVGRPAPARGDDTTQAQLVTTNGHGSVSVVPDQVTISAGIHDEAATATASLTANARVTTAVIGALRRAGGTAIQTEEVSLAPVTNAAGRVTGYDADDSVQASSTVARAGALVDAAVAAGANSVDGPTLSVSNASALYLQALKLAVADARAKAEALAAAGGFGVGPVASVTESDDDGSPLPLASAAPAPSTPVEPGTQDVTADVTVAFGIR